MPFPNIRDYMFAISPPWLRRQWGERFMGVQGLMGDLGMEGVSQGVQVSWMRSGFQPPDVLPFIGNERSMPRYPSDTDATYRDRLAEAWDSWLFAGNEDAITDQLAAFGLSNTRVIPAENADYRVTRPSWQFENPATIEITGLILTYNDDDGGVPPRSEITGPGGTDFAALGVVVGRKVYVVDTALNDGEYEIAGVTGNVITLNDVNLLDDEGPVAGTWLDCTEWSRFAVVIEQTHPYVAWTYGSGHVYGGADDDLTYGSTATVGDVRTIKGIVRKWKAGHTINPYIYVIMSGEYYGDPDLTYRPTVTYGGSTIRWAHQ